MRTGISLSFALLAALYVSVACSGDNYTPEKPAEMIPLQLSPALNGGNGTATKARTDLFTELSNTGQIDGGKGGFRGVYDIRIIPFTDGEGVRSGDVAASVPRTLPAIYGVMDNRAYSSNAFHHGLIYNNYAHVFPDGSLALPVGTRSALVYGKCPRIEDSDPVIEKHLNGSLIEDGWDPVGTYINVNDLTFSPEPIFTGSSASDIDVIIDILTRLVTGVTYTQLYWYQIGDVKDHSYCDVTWSANCGDRVLSSYFSKITGEEQLMAGSVESLEYLLSDIYKRLLSFSSSEYEEIYKHTAGGRQYTAYTDDVLESPLTYPELYDNLKEAILQRFRDMVDSNDFRIDGEGNVSFASQSLRGFPRSLGLPAGASVIR